MKKLLLTLTACTGLLTAQAQGVYQIPNSGFENWAADKEPGNGWNSFASAGGSFASFGSSSPAPEKVEGYESPSAVRLTSKFLIVANANGNLTTGRINMGNYNPTDAANYNFTDLENATHSLLFAGTPDSVAFYAKFKSGGSENGRGQFILHDEYRYCDPETSNEEGYEAHKVALAAALIPECAEWTRFSAPFEYTNTKKPEKQYMLASFTTNPVPGGSANDTLTVDSVVLIYNSELATLTYDGKDIFVKGQTVFNVDSTYISYKLKCTSNGRGATIEKSYDKTTGILTLTVKGNDWSEDNLNQHVYYVKFAQEKLYQLPNADFETWATDKEPGLGWNSFASAGGKWASFASASPAPEKVEGYESNTAVRLTSKNLLIANANGNLTTGRINMGDMTPDNAANYNFTDLEDPAHSLLFAGTPDSVAFYAKFKSGGSENGRGQFILHDEYRYCDPETSNEAGYEAHKVALAAVLVPECAEWTRFAAAFEYTGVEKPEKQYMLASFTTNPVPGGSAKDTLTVDNVVLIYNSELATLTYDGQDIFTEGQTVFHVDGTYDETKLECTSNGRAATIEKSYDKTTGILTLTVKGEDWSRDNLNQHVYYVKFVQEKLYQLPNADFETWAADKEPGLGWNSFVSAGGKWASFASASPAPEKVEGYESNTAVRLTSKNLLIANANGNLTTGRINMGDMTPDNAANYNFTDLEDPAHSLLFAGTPDSVAFYAKFKSGGSENGRGQFILHDEYRYCDPETSNEEGYETHKVALAAALIPECAEWTRFTAPFEYTGVEKPEKQYMLASFTTNPVPGGSANDTLIVDNVVLIYNSELATLTYDGKDIFVKGQNVFHVDELYDETKLAYTANGRAATVETSYNAITSKLVITVKGNDWSEDNLNQHVYTVQFAKEAVYQIPNSDFENWETEDEPGNGWNSFASAGGQWASFASMSPAPEKVEGYESNTAVRLTSKNLFIANANGNLTTGRINMGSMTPKDAANYNFTDLEDGAHNWLFAGTPDSVAFYAKFKSGGSEYGRGQFILHDEYRYCDPETSNEEGYEAHKVALAAALIPECAEWTRFTAPFEYTGVEKPEKQYMLASFTTNPVPGGSANDTLTVDNVVLIYNSELATLTYDGEDILTEGQTAFNVQGKYEEAKLACTSNGRAATIETSYDGDAKVLTITVKGDDWSETNLNQHVYTVTFDESGVGINDIAASAADEPFDVYTLSGVKVRENATNLNGLQRGIYIVNGKKVAVK